MTKLDQIRAAEDRLLLSTYERNPILFVRGEGVHLIDESGDRYLDLLSGIGVNALGYAHPAIETAIARQSRALIHTSNLFYHEGQAELAELLTERDRESKAAADAALLAAWMEAIASGNEDPHDKAAADRHLETLYEETTVPQDTGESIR